MAQRRDVPAVGRLLLLPGPDGAAGARPVDRCARIGTSTGRRTSIEASGAFSELLQHELDHLDGVLAIDRAIDANSLCTREEYERRHVRR